LRKPAFIIFTNRATTGKKYFSAGETTDHVYKLGSKRAEIKVGYQISICPVGTICW